MPHLFIAIGAVAGALARYQVGVWYERRGVGGPGFPWTTLAINVSGSFLMGVLMGSPAVSGREGLRGALVTGFCGSFTTFSTFSYEAVTLMTQGEGSTALLYMGASLVAAPAACLLGYLLSGQFR